MTAKRVSYITYIQAVQLHFELMGLWGEERFGLDSRNLIESALARPKHAARYENADLVRQSASLIFGLIKNHPWTGGNKSTASFLMVEFLFRNKIEVTATPSKLVELCLRVASDEWLVDDIEPWLRQRVCPLNTI